MQWFVLLVILSVQYCKADDPTTIQLISLQINWINGTNPYTMLSYSALLNQNLQVNGNNVAVDSTGNYKNGGYFIVPNDKNATIANVTNVQWTFVYNTTYDEPFVQKTTPAPNATTPAPPPVLSFQCLMTQTISVNSSPGFFNPRSLVNMAWTSNTPGTNDFPKAAWVTMKYSVSGGTKTLTTTTTVKEGNTPAVVAAVIEGIILFIILLYSLYYIFIVRPRQRQMAAFGTGFPGANPAFNNNRPAAGGPQQDGYGYNQPSPIRVEMQDRTPTNAASRPAGAANVASVQTPQQDLPPRADPLAQWPD